MEYNHFKKILNQAIFEKSKSDLLSNIAKYPYRYIGLFRPTKTKAKILQNLLQSHEIKFGEAFEIILEEYFKLEKFELLPKDLLVKKNGEHLQVDLCFQKNDKIYFVEQKIRDDHDSTKKRGQIDNFEKKLNELLKIYNERYLIGIFYFIDPNFKKNYHFYFSRLNAISKDYNIETHIFYGKSLFDFLNCSYIWDEIISYISKWKDQIPDLPETNFDLDAENTFEEIKNLSPQIYRRIFTNQEIFNNIILTLFPQKKTLQLLYDFFSKQNETIYRRLADYLIANLL